MNFNKKELKEKGKRLLANGCALADTSGRTRELEEKSVLALASNKIAFTVLINSSEKKKIFNKLIPNYPEERAKVIIHCVKLYYALKNYLKTCPVFYICADGFNPGLIKQHLRTLLGVEYPENKINILPSLKELFDKRNIADRLAHSVNKKGKKPTLILSEKHFRNLGLKLV